MRFLIIDCYTDEPSGLGVPPYIGTYPRYIFGGIVKNGHDAFYLTIDDIRDLIKPRKNADTEEDMILDTKRYNFSKNHNKAKKLFESSEYVVVISGVQTPGKYLSAHPGTVKEISGYISKIKDNYRTNFRTILAGPGAEIGEGLYGGKKSTSKKFDENFDYVIKDFEYKIDTFLKDDTMVEIEDSELTKIDKTGFLDSDNTYKTINSSAIYGAKLLRQLNDIKLNRLAEIETMRGCKSKLSCSFCTEKLKNPVAEKREPKDVLGEIKALNDEGMKNFRLGKQTCIYSYGTNNSLSKLLSGARKYSDVLHIDNVNPHFVTEEKTKTIVKNTTSGNVAAFGVESFDENVIKANNLNTNPQEAFEAVKTINKYGKAAGENGAPRFLPGINLLFGLNKESKSTQEANMHWLSKMLKEDLLLRRINIREVVVFENTLLDSTSGTKYLKKNRKYYWKWRNQIRQDIDIPMLKKTFPTGTKLKELYTETHDGNNTFARQIGSYPIVVGIKERIPLKKKIDVEVTDYMKRSLVAKKI